MTPFAASLRPVRPILFCVLLATFAACANADAGGSNAGVSAACEGGEPASVRDSAGIRVVESLAPAWCGTQGWTLSAAPILQIGEAEGADAAYLLAFVDGVTRMSDGRVAVANGASGELRFYDGKGVHLYDVGGRGEGPGEYRNISSLRAFRGDSLIVYDSFSRRFSVLDSEGELGRTLILPAPGSGGPQNPAELFADGTILGVEERPVSRAESGRVPHELHFGLFSADAGVRIDSLATLLGLDRYIQRRETGARFHYPVLRTNTWTAAHADEVYLGFSGVPEVEVFGVDGTLRRLIRRGSTPIPVSAAEYAALLGAVLEREGNESDRRAAEEAQAHFPVPQVRPAFSRLLADRAGNLWMRETALFDEPEAWTVFDAQGRWLGPVAFPQGFEPYDIGDDYVLGIATDELDVQQVLMYALEKAAM